MPASSKMERHRTRQVSERSLGRARLAGSSRTTVHVALAANALVMLAKLAGGLLSGSTALLAEAAHSLADTANQAFLRASISLSQRAPTEGRPFGHGQQRFLWTFIAAVSMFVAGAVFAIGYGILELLRSKHEAVSAVAWATLAVAAIAEGASWLRALRQVRGEAREAGRPLVRYVREARDPNVKMVLFEDSVALIGIAIAATGIGLHQLTRQAFWDPAASLAIGVLLVGVAAWMALDVSGLLVGAAARPDERRQIQRVLEDADEVRQVQELLTMVLGPNALLVCARVDLDDGIDARRVELAATELDHAIREAVPDVTEVFIDATPGGSAHPELAEACSIG